MSYLMVSGIFNIVFLKLYFQYLIVYQASHFLASFPGKSQLTEYKFMA